METRFLPQTTPGKWSVVLSGISLLANIIFIILASGGNLVSEQVPWAGAVISVAVFAAFATGITAIILRKERSFLVYLGMAAQVMVFITGEFLVVH